MRIDNDLLAGNAMIYALSSGARFDAPNSLRDAAVKAAQDFVNGVLVFPVHSKDEIAKILGGVPAQGLGDVWSHLASPFKAVAGAVGDAVTKVADVTGINHLEQEIGTYAIPLTQAVTAFFTFNPVLGVQSLQTGLAIHASPGGAEQKFAAPANSQDAAAIIGQVAVALVNRAGMDPNSAAGQQLVSTYAARIASSTDPQTVVNTIVAEQDAAAKSANTQQQVTDSTGAVSAAPSDLSKQVIVANNNKLLVTADANKTGLLAGVPAWAVWGGAGLLVFGIFFAAVRR